MSEPRVALGGAIREPPQGVRTDAGSDGRTQRFTRLPVADRAGQELCLGGDAHRISLGLGIKMAELFRSIKSTHNAAQRLNNVTAGRERACMGVDLRRFSDLAHIVLIP